MAWLPGPLLLAWDGDDEDVRSGAKTVLHGDEEDACSGANAWVEVGRRTSTPPSRPSTHRRVVWPMSRGGGIDFMVLPFPPQGQASKEE